MIDIRPHSDVLEIVIDNPPVNALSAPVRKGISAALSQALADPAIRVIIIRGNSTFSAGADITEFDRPFVEPDLQQIIEAIEASDKPVLAAVHGHALGGGLELALGCHYRIAAPASKLGLPEVLLGVLPGAGGTQRLPRLVGVEAALNMIVSGTPVSAAKAIDIGLVDRLSDDDASLAEEAIAFARTLAAPRRTGDLSVTADPAVFERFAAENARLIKDLEAPKACIDAVRASTCLLLSCTEK